MDILVVDDSATMRRLIVKALTMVGLEAGAIAEAKDGEEAHEMIVAHAPRLVLCDVNMPRLTGAQLLERLQGMAKRPIVVMITSLRSTKTKLDLIRLGAAKVIHKPFEPHRLASELAQYVMPPAAAPVEDEVAFCPDEDPVEPSSAGPTTPNAPPDAVVADCLREALETMAFSPGDEASEEVPPLRSSLFRADIRVGGMGFALLATADSAALLSSRIVGEHPGGDDQARLDAMAELANVVGGQAAERLGGQLGLPNTSVLSPGLRRAPLRCQLVEQGAPIFIELQLEAPTP